MSNLSPSKILLTSSLISGIGSQLTLLSIPILAVSYLHYSPEQYSFLMTGQSVAAIIFLPLAGIYIDKLSPFYISKIANLSSAISILILFLFLNFNINQFWLVYVSLILVNSCSCFITVADGSMPPFIFKDTNKLHSFNSSLATIAAIVAILGPSLGAIFVNKIPPSSLLLIDALSFFIAFLLVRKIYKEYLFHNKSSNSSGISWWKNALSGFLQIWVHLPVRWTSLVTAASNFSLSCTNVVLAFSIIKILGVDALGIIYAMGGLGALIGSLIAGKLPFLDSPKIPMITSLTVVSVSYTTIGIIFTSNKLLSTLIVGSLLAIGDLFIILYNIYSIRIRQQYCAKEIQGRTTAAVRLLSRISSLFGTLLGGFILSRFDVIFSFIFIGSLFSTIAFLSLLTSSKYLGALDSSLGTPI